MTHLSNTRFLILWHLQDTLCPFSEYINDESLNHNQIAFLNKIIRHVELNGYMDDVGDLLKPPFDKPISFMKMFDKNTRNGIVKKLNEIKENAVDVIA